jgi:hypothetical protein
MSISFPKSEFKLIFGDSLYFGYELRHRGATRHVFLYIRRMVALPGIMVASIEGHLSPEDGFAEDGSDDLCIMRIRCILTVCWTSEAVLDDARWWEVEAYDCDHGHPFIKFVDVAILIAKRWL